MSLAHAFPQSIPWQVDPFGLLHRLFWNEHAEDPDESVFRSLGVVHLYAASGIHVYAFLQTIESISYTLSRRFSLDLRWMKRAALAVALLFLGWAWALQSFRPGFARPLITFFLRQWARHHGARFRLLAPLLLTLALDLVLGFGGGRAHYYLAIAGGLFAMDWLEKRRGVQGILGEERPAGEPPGIRVTHLALSIGSWVLTAPVDLLLDHRITWMTPVYSLLTLPVLTHALYPATLLSLAWSGRIPALLLQGWTSLMNAIVWIADHVPGPIVVSPLSIFAGAVFAAFVLVLRHRSRGWRLRARIATAMTMLLAAVLIRPGVPSSPTLTQLSVGQGDALLVATPQRVELIDVGPEQRGLSSGDWITAPTLRGAMKIDTVLLSHLDADHVHGLVRAMPWMEVGCIETHPRHWQSEKGHRLEEFLARFFPRVRRGKGECFRSGEVAWFGSDGARGADGNDWMAGVLIPLGEGRAYLAAGDADRNQERQYLTRFGPELEKFPHRIWKLSHHGSRFASDPEVLAKLAPEQLWVSVGRHNPYHHPNPETLRRVRSLGRPLYRTDEDGALTAKISQASRAAIFE